MIENRSSDELIVPLEKQANSTVKRISSDASVAEAARLRAVENFRTRLSESYSGKSYGTIILEMQEKQKERELWLRRNSEAFLDDQRKFAEQIRHHSEQMRGALVAASAHHMPHKNPSEMFSGPIDYSHLKPKVSPEATWQQRQITLFESVGGKLDAVASFLQESAEYSRSTRDIQAELLSENKAVRQEASEIATKVNRQNIAVMVIALLTLVATIASLFT